MAGLPPNWEWDYDGQRWFYKYKPNGHIQYHFPSEGDEFPDFIEAGAPVPALAPEERLESQQQVKRQTTSADGNNTPASAKGDPSMTANSVNNLGMSATAQPISAIWEGNDEGCDGAGVFQPENFMFLGPGTYLDVSPLIEEEEEAAKRSVVGGTGEKVEKGVSPLASEKTTPMMENSDVVKEEGMSVPELASAAGMTMSSRPTDVSVDKQPIDREHQNDTHELSSATAPVSAVVEAPDTSAIHILDSREMPVEMLGDTAHRFDPVGIVPEMPTEHTGKAHIEVSPDPVEIADNTVLAPIETRESAQQEHFELPEGEADSLDGATNGNDTTAVNEQERDVDEVDQSRHEVGENKEQKGIAETDKRTHKSLETPILEDQASKKEDDKSLPESVDGNRDQEEAEQSAKESKAVADQPDGPDVSQQSQIQSNILTQVGRKPQRAQTWQPDYTPETFKIARKLPASHSQQRTYQAYVPGQTSAVPPIGKGHTVSLLCDTSMNPGRATDPDVSPTTRVLSPSQYRGTHMSESENQLERTKQDLPLVNVPSVLKPARELRHSIQGLPSTQGQTAHPVSSNTDGVSKCPSVLRPARGRSPSLPNQPLLNPAHVTTSPIHGSPVRVQDAQQTWSARQPPSGQAYPGQYSFRPQQIQPTANSDQPGRGHAPYGAPYAVAPGQRHSIVGSHPQAQAAAIQPRRPQSLIEGIRRAPSMGVPKQAQVVQYLRPSRPQSVVVVGTNRQPQQNDSYQRQPSSGNCQAQPPQNDQDASSGKPVGSQSPVGKTDQPAQAEQLLTSLFEIKPLKNVQNAEAGQPLRAHGVLGPHQSTPVGLTSAQPSGDQQGPFPTSQSQIQRPSDDHNAEGGQLVDFEALQELHRPADSDAATTEQGRQSLTTSQNQRPAQQQHQSVALDQPTDTQTAPGFIPSTLPMDAQVANARSQSAYNDLTHPGMRRASTGTSVEASPNRSRAGSEVSSVSPMEPYGHSTSAVSVINGASHTPSPVANLRGSSAQGSTNPDADHSSGQVKSPPVPPKIRENIDGSLFPIQNGSDGLTQQQSTQQHLAQPSQSLEGSNGDQVLGKSPRRNSAPAPSYHNDSFVPGSGRLLGRIEEYDESEQPRHRAVSIASSNQQSTSGRNVSVPAAKFPEPKSSVLGQTQQLFQSLGQTVPVPMAQNQQGQPFQGIFMPPGSTQHQLPLGNISQVSAGPWNPSSNPNGPSPSPQGKTDKEKRWTKWFKGTGNKSQSNSSQPQMMPPQPGPIPKPAVQPWTGGPYSPAHIRQPEQPGPPERLPPGQLHSEQVRDQTAPTNGFNPMEMTPQGMPSLNQPFGRP